MADKVHPLVVFRNYFDNRAGELRHALPTHITPEKFIRTIVTAAQTNPDLLACDKPSLWNACIRCAADGLLPDGREAAIVLYKNKAGYIPMYQGLLKLFRNSGEFRWVGAGIVFEGDEYDHWTDEKGEHFHHRPADDNDGKKVRRVYALATTKDGGSFIADMSMSEIHKRRAMSRASRDDSPWKQWPEEMAKKTAIRVLSKFLPKSSDLERVIEHEEELEREAERNEPAQPRLTTASALDAFGASQLQSAPEEGAPAPATDANDTAASQVGSGGADS